MTTSTPVRQLLFAVAAVLVLTAATTQTRPSDKSVAKWTNDQLKKILVVPAERMFDRIGWADNLIQAEQLAAKTNRPLFLFMYDGDLASGRC